MIKLGNEKKTTLLYYKDEEKDVKTIIDKFSLNGEYIEESTNSLAIYNISPTLVTLYNKNPSIVYPKIRLDENDKDIVITSDKIDVTQDIKIIKEKYEIKENNLQRKENNYIDFGGYEDEIEILKSENADEGPKKHLDKFNLFRGFIYANDPLNIKSKIDYDDEYDNCEIKFQPIEEILEHIFEIK